MFLVGFLAGLWLGAPVAWWACARLAQGREARLRAYWLRDRRRA